MPVISIRPMTETEFEAFLAQSVKSYAEEKAEAGDWTAEEALDRSRKEHDRLLPNGLSTPHQHLYTIESKGQKAGRVWLSSDPATAGGSGFIYDLYIGEPFRRQGVAKRAMLLIEQEARRLGLKSLALHVFGHNDAARALYEGLGYTITNLNMAKPLSDT